MLLLWKNNVSKKNNRKDFLFLFVLCIDLFGKYGIIIKEKFNMSHRVSVIPQKAFCQGIIGGKGMR